MNYLIIDKTNNTSHEFIGHDNENCGLEENATVYPTEQDAEQKIKDNDWGGWADILGTNYPVNY